MSLTNLQLDRFFLNRHTGLPIKSYGGCYTKDQLADMTPEPRKFYIVNLDNSTGEGTHWTAVYNVNPYNILYFDPFGTAPPEDVLKFMRRAKTAAKNSARHPRKKMFFSTSQIQDIDSSQCGWYVAFMMKMLLQGIPFLDILMEFDTAFDQWKNDQLLQEIKRGGYIQEFSRMNW